MNSAHKMLNSLILQLIGILVIVLGMNRLNPHTSLQYLSQNNAKNNSLGNKKGEKKETINKDKDVEETKSKQTKQRKITTTLEKDTLQHYQLNHHRLLSAFKDMEDAESNGKDFESSCICMHEKYANAKKEKEHFKEKQEELLESINYAYAREQEGLK